MFDEHVAYEGNPTRFTEGLLHVFRGLAYCASTMDGLTIQTTPVQKESPEPDRLTNSWVNMFALWNWKSAVLSIMLRVPVFAVAAARRGLEATGAAILTEAIVCGFNAGCYAAVVQVLRDRKPVWLTALLIAVGLPAIGQVIEYEAHAWRGTPHRGVAVIISSVLAGISSLFNWYAMKQGALLVGGEGKSLGHDLSKIPRLLGHFLLIGPRWVMRRIKWMALQSN